MPAPRFCSACGEKLRRDRAVSLKFHNVCRRCGGRVDHIRFTLFLVPLLCLAIGFAIGSYSRSREPFQYIGEVIELGANSATLPGSVDAPPAPRHTVAGERPDENVNAKAITEGICGARTKSGRPCQRKVKGGGRCWQHRDK